MDRETLTKSKGGRPKKAVKKDCFIGVRCTADEKKLIQAKATQISQGAGEFLRNLGLDRQIDMKRKALPKDVLLLTGTLNHLGANINQLAKKRNIEQTLNVFEMECLPKLAKELRELASLIKSHVR